MPLSLALARAAGHRLAAPRLSGPPGRLALNADPFHLTLAVAPTLAKTPHPDSGAVTVGSREVRSFLSGGLALEGAQDSLLLSARRGSYPMGHTLISELTLWGLCGGRELSVEGTLIEPSPTARGQQLVSSPGRGGEGHRSPDKLAAAAQGAPRLHSCCRGTCCCNIWSCPRPWALVEP